MKDERTRKFLDLLWLEQQKLDIPDNQFAEKLGVPASTISRLKSGKYGRRLSAEFLFLAATHFIAIREFLTEEVLRSKESSSNQHKAVA